MNRYFGILIVLGLMAAGTEASAAGFALREYSATAQGNAFAGVSAAAEDISYMSHNPAGLTRQHGTEAAFDAVWIAPRAEFVTTSASTVLGGPIGGGNGGEDGGPDVLAPALYFATDLGDGLRAGVSMFVPFGFKTNYEHGWIGRYHALKTSITTFDVNPVLAYKALPWLSVGGGVQIAYTKASISNAIDVGTFDVVQLSGAFGGTPTADDSSVKVDGDDIALGYNLGVLVELSPDTRIGAAFRSALHTQLDGDARFANGAVGAAIAGATGLFTDTGVRAEINLPEVASLGVYQRLSPQWEVMGEVAWTNWSRLRELRVQFDNTVQTDDVIVSQWKDSWFFSLGATYRPGGGWALRTGVAYDQTPTRDAYRTPRIPVNDRYWISAGVQYAYGNGVMLDIGYTHLFVEHPEYNLTTADVNNTFRGNLSGRSENAADVLAVQFRVSF